MISEQKWPPEQGELAVPLALVVHEHHAVGSSEAGAQHVLGVVQRVHVQAHRRWWRGGDAEHRNVTAVGDQKAA